MTTNLPALRRTHISSLLPGVMLAMAMLQACSFGPRMHEESIALPNAPADRIETHVFGIRGDDNVLGELSTVPVREDDTFSDLARHYGLGFTQMSEANPHVDPWIPPAGERVLLPTRFILPDAPRKGLVINLATMRLYQFPALDGAYVYSYPVGIGREGRASPVGSMTVDRKMPNPAWYVPESIRRDHAKKGDPLPAMVPAGPDNPLGEFAMYLSRPSYLIHGTNKPFSVGVRASNGCIRLYPEDIRLLFHDVKEKTPVHIVNQPYLVGTSGKQVYLEAHDPHAELNAKQARATAVAKLKLIEKKRGVRLDWGKVDQVLAEARGIPVPVTQNSATVAELIALAQALDHPADLHGQPESVRQEGNGWYVRAIETPSENDAEKMSAMLNHLGPRIPARAVKSNGRYEVMAGPYADAKAAKAAVRQLKFELELTAEVVNPGQAGKLSLSRNP